ncbi:hypothetical protein QAD02_003464 [Eretmocerus hayati]|uniref:Uncharacterized protein n=1 Tax=Eretmocerus hayati TaxID=131215 RepID=A0ACC2NLR8_9HYME|nr:hypothetical protein QAD02_003464 [Eretmocerus hayati]
MRISVKKIVKKMTVQKRTKMRISVKKIVKRIAVQKRTKMRISINKIVKRITVQKRTKMRISVKKIVKRITVQKRTKMRISVKKIVKRITVQKRAKMRIAVKKIVMKLPMKNPESGCGGLNRGGSLLDLPIIHSNEPAIIAVGHSSQPLVEIINHQHVPPNASVASPSDTAIDTASSSNDTPMESLIYPESGCGSLNREGSLLDLPIIHSNEPAIIAVGHSSQPLVEIINHQHVPPNAPVAPPSDTAIDTASS